MMKSSQTSEQQILCAFETLIRNKLHPPQLDGNSVKGITSGGSSINPSSQEGGPHRRKQLHFSTLQYRRSAF